MTPFIASHAIAATLALLLGGWQLFLSTKGSPLHRLVGWVWVGLTAYVALSSFRIQTLRPGHFSLLHLLSVVTIITTSLGIRAAMRGDVQGHRGNMVGTWIGMCFAFGFAVAVPGRAIPEFALARPTSAAIAALILLGATAAILGLARLVTRADAAPVSDGPA